MSVLDSSAELIESIWALFSIWTLFQILRLSWPVIKVDWFWYPTKSKYYLGFLLGVLWFVAFDVPVQWLGKRWFFLPMLIQAAVAFFYLKRKSSSKLERNVWLSMPIFMFPFWLAFRQGQREGVMPESPNPPLKSDPTCTA
jgi:hypothetical protein